MPPNAPPTADKAPAPSTGVSTTAAPSAVTTPGVPSTGSTTTPAAEPTFSDNPSTDADPRAVPAPGVAKLGTKVIVRRRGRPDAVAFVAEVASNGLVTAIVLRPDHPLETAKNLGEINPEDTQLTGWYFPAN